MSRPPARTRGLKQYFNLLDHIRILSRPPARTRGLKPKQIKADPAVVVASSREDAWIETCMIRRPEMPEHVASSREDAWIETGVWLFRPNDRAGRVLPRGRVD